MLHQAGVKVAAAVGRPEQATSLRDQRTLESRLMLTILLIVLLILAIGGGSWGHSRYGYAGWSPAGIIVLVLLLLWFTGGLHA
jgi:uncharacterized protein DUF3309